MVYVYKVFFSDSVKLVAAYDCMDDYFNSEFYGCKDIVVEVKEVW